MTDDQQQQVRDMVKRAITAAVPADGFIERRSRPESTYSWKEPSPTAGLAAALKVVAIAQRQAYEYVTALRGEGAITWRGAADVLGIEWSDQYARAERAYELVLGPAPEGSSPFYERRLYWYCRGTGGCGEYITDHGPYNGYPSDCESGHADDCRRHAAEQAAHVAELERQEQLVENADRANKELIAELGEHSFAVETAARGRYVLRHGGQYLGWSTSERLAVALALNDEDVIAEWGSRQSAIDRVFEGTREPARGRAWWLATVRAAATGETDQ